MNFQDIGIIIAKRPLKENASIVTVFTQSHGLYSGMIRENSKAKGSINQPGNYVDFFWQARLHEHLGHAKCELIKSFGAVILLDKTKLYTFNSLICLIKIAFHEREPHNNFFSFLLAYLESLVSDNFDFKNYVKLELSILSEAGYPLDLSSCAITNQMQNLKYVSPKSGRAVSAEAGHAYASKLLPLPSFIGAQHQATINVAEINQAFELITYFFLKYFNPKQSDIEARQVLISYLLNKEETSNKI